MRRKEVIIELTSLLDVILIIIFMVLNQNGSQMEKQNEQLESISEENQQLKDENGDLSEELKEALSKLEEGDLEKLIEQLNIANSEINSYEYMNEVISIINVNLSGKYGNWTLSYGMSGENQSKWSTTRIKSTSDLVSPLNELKVYLDDKVSDALNNSDASFVYIVFNYDSSQINAKLYEMIDDALKNTESRDTTGQVRYRGNNLKSTNQSDSE